MCARNFRETRKTAGAHDLSFKWDKRNMGQEKWNVKFMGHDVVNIDHNLRIIAKILMHLSKA